MSFSNQSPRAAHLQQFIDTGVVLTNAAKVDGTASGLYQSVSVGQESTRTAAHRGEIAKLNTRTAGALSKASIEVKSKAALAAGHAIIAAAADPQGYTQLLARESAGDFFEPGYSGKYGADYGKDSMVGSEYYTEKDLDKNLGLSYAMNVRALETQSKFAETLYPTITVDAGDAGVSIRTKVTKIYTGMRHALYKKDSVLPERRNLVDALTDHTVFEDDAIALVPYMLPDGGNSEAFVDKALIEPSLVTLGKCPSYETSYLKFDQSERNLFSLAAHPGIAAEGYNETDEIASGAALSKILVSVRKKGEALSDASLMEINVQNMQYATFQRPAEGGGRELVLNFRKNKFGLSGETRDRNGDEIPALSSLKNQDMRLQYTMKINGDITVNDGVESISPCTVKVITLVNAQGGLEAFDKTGTGKTIVDNIVIEALGFKYDMTRTNENRRTQGALLESMWETENFKLRLGSPLTTKSPIGGEGVDDAERLDDLISSVNIRNEGLSVTQTLNYSEQLEQLIPTLISEYDTVSIQGLGRHWIRPWFERKTFNASTDVSSLESKDLLANNRAAILAQIGDQVTRGVQVSRYMPALRTYLADPEARPTVVIACDEVTASMLLMAAPGESRLLGDRYNFEVITTNDSRWRDDSDKSVGTVRRLQWFLKVESEAGSVNVLNWGNHFWTPVLVTNTNIQRQGTTSKELTVQPRNLHMCHCPISGVFDITGISVSVNNKPVISVNITEMPVVEEAPVAPAPVA